MAENITIFPTSLTYSRNTKAPLMDKQLFETLAEAKSYINDKDQTAYVGLTISVINDEPNNGLYYVASIADSTNNTGNLVRVTSDSTIDVAQLQVKVSEIESIVGNDTLGLVASVKKNTTDIGTKADKFTVGKGLNLIDNEVSIAISNVVGNSLSINDTGLYVSVPEINVPEYNLVAVDQPADGCAAQYVFKKGDEIVTTINIPKDQFLKTASYDKDAKKFIFVFDTKNGEQTQEIDVKDLTDTYSEGDYITITDTSISVNYDSLKSQLDTDIINPIRVSVTNLSDQLTTISSKISTLETSTTDYVARINVIETTNKNQESRIAVLEGVQHPTLVQVTTLEKNYDTLNKIVTNISDNLSDIKVKCVDTTVSNGVSLNLSDDGMIGVTVNIDTIANAVIAQHTVDANNIVLGANIGTEKNPDRYTDSDNIHSVLVNINERIEGIDATIQNVLNNDITDIEAGDGISVDSTVATKPVVSVKVVNGSALKLNASGLDLVWEELS
jgi:hypothetical protein